MTPGPMTPADQCPVPQPRLGATAPTGPMGSVGR